MNSKLLNKPVIGVVGGIGSGKSEVARMFAGCGGDLFDADSEVHGLLKDEAVKLRIKNCFGEAIFDLQGEIDRKELAKIVFGETKSRELLESILHPLILRNAEQKIKIFKEFSKFSFLVMDIPLIIEKGWSNLCSFLIFVDCDRTQRLRRCEKRGWTEAEWEKRENSQMPLTKKALFCEYRIDNSGDLAYTNKQVLDLIEKLNLPCHKTL